jgi:hypothetical protein
MPVFVRAFRREVVDRLNTPAFVAPITQLSPVGAQAIAQLTLRRRHARPRLVVMHSELLDDLARTSFGRTAGVAHGAFEGAALIA